MMEAGDQEIVQHRLSGQRCLQCQGKLESLCFKLFNLILLCVKNCSVRRFSIKHFNLSWVPNSSDGKQLLKTDLKEKSSFHLRI